MEICSSSHVEIVYENIVYKRNGCPLCEALKEISNLEKQAEEEEKKISELNQKISNLEEENEQLRRGNDPKIAERNW